MLFVVLCPGTPEGSTSVGRCVIPCAFFGKSVKHFLVEKCILFKKKDVYNSSLAF